MNCEIGFIENLSGNPQDRWSHRKRPGGGVGVPGLELPPINPNQFIKPISAMAAATVDTIGVRHALIQPRNSFFSKFQIELGLSGYFL